MKKYNTIYQPCVAIKMTLAMMPLVYTAWGGTQVGKPGDWLVSKNGEVYTVDAESFERAYKNISLGVYAKSFTIWAKVAEDDGFIPTKEGQSAFKKGDYLCFNGEFGVDGWPIPAAKFKTLYVEVY